MRYSDFKTDQKLGINEKNKLKAGEKWKKTSL